MLRVAVLSVLVAASLGYFLPREIYPNHRQLYEDYRRREPQLTRSDNFRHPFYNFEEYKQDPNPRGYRYEIPFKTNENADPSVRRHPFLHQEDVETPVRKDELVRKFDAASDKKDEPVPVKKDEPVPVKKDEPAPVKKDEPAHVKKDEPAPVKKDEPAPVKKDEPAPVKTDEPAPVKKDEPAPVKKDEPAPVKKDEPAPVKKDEPAPVKKDEPAPVKKDAPIRMGELIPPPGDAPLPFRSQYRQYGDVPASFRRQYRQQNHKYGDFVRQRYPHQDYRRLPQFADSEDNRRPRYDFERYFGHYAPKTKDSPAKEDAPAKEVAVKEDTPVKDEPSKKDEGKSTSVKDEPSKKDEGKSTYVNLFSDSKEDVTPEVNLFKEEKKKEVVLPKRLADTKDAQKKRMNNDDEISKDVTSLGKLFEDKERDTKQHEARQYNTLADNRRIPASHGHDAETQRRTGAILRRPFERDARNDMRRFYRLPSRDAIHQNSPFSQRTYERDTRNDMRRFYRLPSRDAIRQNY